MRAGKNPGFVGYAGRIRTTHQVVTANLHHASALALLLGHNVAEDAALLFLEVVAAGAQFIEHTPGNEGSRRELGSGMQELLAGIRPVILENTDVFDAGIPLEV